MHDVLVEALHAAVVVVGDNFRFGHRAAGDVPLLERLGRSFGFTVEDAPLVAEDGLVFSSTYIRSCVDAGDVRAAAAALGRPHRPGRRGRPRRPARAARSAFPTANLMVHRYAAVPADGVYAAWLIRGGERAGRLPASVSIGTNPTFSGRERRVEAYVLDFAGDLYGERVSLDFVAHLREQRRYDGIEPLVAQIREDVEETRALLR